MDKENFSFKKILFDLYSVKNTLNQVTVSGSDNWDKLLGCVQKLDEMIQKVQEAETDE